MDVLFEPCESSDPPTLRFNEPSCNGQLNDDSETGQMVLEPFPSFSFPLFSFTASRGNPFLDSCFSLSLSFVVPPYPYLFNVSQSWTKREIWHYKWRCPLYCACFYVVDKKFNCLLPAPITLNTSRTMGLFN